MYVSATISINLSKLKKFRSDITAQLNGNYGPVYKALNLWAVRYRSFSQQRFDLFSKGGGDWKELAETTIAKRRKGTTSNVKALREIWSAKLELNQKKDSKSVSGGGQYSILRDTGLLFGALQPIFAGAPGAVEQRIKFGIRVGYGGPQRHALGQRGKAVTIADIASFHQNGALPHLPKRQVIVNPPLQVIKQMEDDMHKAIQKLIEDGGIK